jgi:hypothetical protein
MRSLPLLLALAAVTLTLAACDSSADLQIGGSYTATQTIEGVAFAYTLVIPTTEDGGSFPFTIAVTSDAGGNSRTGNGTYTHPNIRLSPEGASTASGTVTDDGDTLTVRVEGETLVFRR